MFCMKCGTQLPENSIFCHVCGTKAEDVSYQNPVVTLNQNNEPKASKKVNTGMLVWSILNFFLCGEIFSALGLLFTILAATTSNAADEIAHLKKARLFNIIGTVIGAALWLFIIGFYILYFFFAIAISTAGAY